MVPSNTTARLFAEVFVVKNLKSPGLEHNAEWAVAHTLCGNPVQVYANADTIRAVMEAHDSALPRDVAKSYGEAEAVDDGHEPLFQIPPTVADRMRAHLVSANWQALKDTASALTEAPVASNLPSFIK